jgi:hypothetical protein
MQKRVVNKHKSDSQKFLLHKNFDVKGKQRAFATTIAITNFFGNVKPYKNSKPIQMGFIDNLVLMITKS